MEQKRNSTKNQDKNDSGFVEYVEQDYDEDTLAITYEPNWSDLPDEDFMEQLFPPGYCMLGTFQIVEGNPPMVRKTLDGKELKRPQDIGAKIVNDRMVYDNTAGPSKRFKNAQTSTRHRQNPQPSIGKQLQLQTSISKAHPQPSTSSFNQHGLPVYNKPDSGEQPSESTGGIVIQDVVIMPAKKFVPSVMSTPNKKDISGMDISLNSTGEIIPPKVEKQPLYPFPKVGEKRHPVLINGGLMDDWNKLRPTTNLTDFVRKLQISEIQKFVLEKTGETLFIYSEDLAKINIEKWKQSKKGTYTLFQPGRFSVKFKLRRDGTIRVISHTYRMKNNEKKVLKRQREHDADDVEFY